MQVNVKVSGQNVRGESCYHGDTLDMESFQRRAAFIKQAAHELATKEETIHREVGQLWTVLTDLQREMLSKTLAPAEEKSAMTAEEKTAAMELLRDPRLLERVLEDFDKCGVVGEETNKRCYLAAVSRLLEKPLAIVVQSASSAGKCSLMEAVLDFVPEEQRENYTAMTGQALFYMGQKNLKHKILAIRKRAEPSRLSAEAVAVGRRAEDRLDRQRPGERQTGDARLPGRRPGDVVPHHHGAGRGRGVAESLHCADRERGAGADAGDSSEAARGAHHRRTSVAAEAGKLVKLHRNAQRLLRPITVVNNHDVGEFPDYMTRTRRDHKKLLTLIEAIALLHQHQREIKTITREGDTLEYIEATEQDVKLAE